MIRATHHAAGSAGSAPPKALPSFTPGAGSATGLDEPASSAAAVSGSDATARAGSGAAGSDGVPFSETLAAARLPAVPSSSPAQALTDAAPAAGATSPTSSSPVATAPPPGFFAKPSWLKPDRDCVVVREMPTAFGAVPARPAGTRGGVSSPVPDLYTAPSWLQARQVLTDLRAAAAATATTAAAADAAARAATSGTAPQVFTVPSWFKGQQALADAVDTATASDGNHGRPVVHRGSDSAGAGAGVRAAGDLPGAASLLLAATVTGLPSAPDSPPIQAGGAVPGVGPQHTGPALNSLQGRVAGEAELSGAAISQDRRLTGAAAATAPSALHPSVDGAAMSVLDRADIAASSVTAAPNVPDAPPVSDAGRTSGAAGVDGATPDAVGSFDPGAAMRTLGASLERAPATEIRTINVDAGSPQWPKAVAAELVLLGHQKVESATLRLSPEHLGNIEVHIHLDAKVVNLSFGASHAETRAALEQALPQLRDGFAQAGLTLGQATVQQQMRQESQNEQVVPQPDRSASEEVITKSEVRQALSLVDEYA